MLIRLPTPADVRARVQAGGWHLSRGVRPFRRRVLRSRPPNAPPPITAAELIAIIVAYAGRLQRAKDAPTRRAEAATIEVTARQLREVLREGAA